MMKKRSLGFALSAVMLLSACGRQVQPSPPRLEGYSGEVCLFCSMQEEQILAIEKGFEAKYPGIDMHYFFAGTNKVLTKLATEMQAGKISADLVWTGSPTDYLDMKEDRFLSPYISPQAININEAFVDEHHYYIGGRLMNMVIAYNTELISPEDAPKSWDELLSPCWKGKMVMTDPGSAGSSKYFAAALMQSPKYGEDYFRRLRDNGCTLESNTTSTHLRVAQGTYPVGICLDYVAKNLQDEGMPIAFIEPEKDSVPIYCPMGLVAGCPNERNGRLLYDFILSKEGQQILIDNDLHSIRDDMDSSAASMDSILAARLPVDDALLSQDMDELMNSFDSIFFHNS